MEIARKIKFYFNYEIINVSFKLLKGPNNRLKIGTMGLIAKQKWQKKSQLSEVVEDTEVNEEPESKSPTSTTHSMFI